MRSDGSTAVEDPRDAVQGLAHLARASAAVVFGTRPEIIKLAGIIELLDTKARTIFSGQHFDPLLSNVFFDELRLPPPDAMLGVGGRSRPQQLGRIVLRLEEQFTGWPPAIVIVQGDTNTALGGALAANAMNIPLVHVEAGLRSFDRRMPEEHNRVVIDHLADVCLAPTETARGNLLAEGIPEARIAVTGNTVVDAATRLIPAADERATLLERMGLRAGEYVLATFHRPENVDDRDRLEAILDQLSKLEIPVVFPVHPRTRQHIETFRLAGKVKRVEMVSPLGYGPFLALAAESACLVSDSGGVQEEATVVKRPAIVVRRSTDRPEANGTFATLIASPRDLADVAGRLLATLDDVHRRLADCPSPYGDGRASERSVKRIALALSKTE